MVRVRVFDSSGQLVGPIEVPKVELADDEWRRRLTSQQFEVLRCKGTERPFCGTLLDNKQQGVYTCAGCGLPLFSSDAKFNSGTGWPSFFQPIGAENVVNAHDNAYGMLRTEILCGRCDGHLGHVFDDGPRPTGLRFCLNSESLNFTPSEQLASLADPATSKSTAADLRAATDQNGAQTVTRGALDTAVFAGGCFWCTEEAFAQLEGVADVESGYAGGDPDTANYEDVCSGTTGHAEGICIQFDPAKISFAQLLDVFFDAHDPTQLNGQGNDIGTQYRSAIFFANETQQRAAAARIAELNATGKFRRPIVTTLEPLTAFYPAEDYHQDYAVKNPNQPYVRYHSMPKACAIREKHPDLIRSTAAASTSKG